MKNYGLALLITGAAALLILASHVFFTAAVLGLVIAAVIGAFTFFRKEDDK